MNIDFQSTGLSSQQMADIRKACEAVDDGTITDTMRIYEAVAKYMVDELSYDPERVGAALETVTFLYE